MVTLPSILTIAAAAAALMLVLHAVRATLAARRDEADAASGSRYDALHESVTLADVGRDASGFPTLDLHYDRGQIVFFDAVGTPETAQSTGPGAIVVRIPRALYRRLRRRRAAADTILSIVERGTLTASGRVVHECYLAARTGGSLPATMTAASAFPAA